MVIMGWLLNETHSIKPEDKIRGDLHDLHHGGKQTQYGLFYTKEAVYDEMVCLANKTKMVLFSSFIPKHTEAVSEIIHSLTKTTLCTKSQINFSW